MMPRYGGELVQIRNLVQTKKGMVARRSLSGQPLIGGGSREAMISTETLQYRTFTHSDPESEKDCYSKWKDVPTVHEKVKG